MIIDKNSVKYESQAVTSSTVITRDISPSLTREKSRPLPQLPGIQDTASAEGAGSSLSSISDTPKYLPLFENNS